MLIGIGVGEDVGLHTISVRHTSPFQSHLWWQILMTQGCVTHV